MEDKEIQFILRQIEDAYDPASRNQQNALNSIASYSTYDYTFGDIEKLFGGAATLHSQSFATNVLKRNVVNNWNAIDEMTKDQIVVLVRTNLPASSPPVSNQLANILAIIAIRDFPSRWPSFFEEMLEGSTPSPQNFAVIAEFFSLVTNSDSNEITASQSKLILGKMKDAKKIIIEKCIASIEVPEAALALKEFMPYFQWTDIKEGSINGLMSEIASDTSKDRTQQINLFAIICTLGCVEGAPVEMVSRMFCLLFDMSGFLNQNEMANAIFPFLLKNAEVLEVTDTLHLFREINTKILELGLTNYLEYWENFVLSIFNTYKTSGSLDRFIAHQAVLFTIRDYALRNMPRPPDFIIPQEDATMDEGARSENNQMKNIFISILTMSPDSILPAVSSLFAEVESTFNYHMLLSIVWSLACMAGATGSIVEGQLVIESLTFLLNEFKRIERIEKMDNKVEIMQWIAASFLFLVASYARAQKLTSQFIAIALKFCTSGLNSYFLRNLATQVILAVGCNCSSLVLTLSSIERIQLNTLDIPQDMYTDVCEGVGKIYQAHKKLQVLIDIVMERWNVAKESNDDNEIIYHAHYVLCALLGFAHSDPVNITKVVNKILPDVISLVTSFGQHIIQMDCNTDDMRKMAEFIKTVAVLFKFCGIKICTELFTIYNESQPSMRQIEILQLAEALLKTELTDAEALVIHQMIIDPTKEMISADESHDSSFVSYIPSVINVYLQSHFASSMEAVPSMEDAPCIIAQDLDFLLSLIKSTNRSAVFGSMNAIENCITKADLTMVGENRQGFFRLFFIQTLSTILLVSTEPSHRYFLDKIIVFIAKLFKFISAERIQTNLFDPPLENKEGTIQALSFSLCQELPLISKKDMNILIESLLDADDFAEFQSIMVEFISAARQTIPGETLRHLQMKRIKSVIEQDD